MGENWDSRLATLRDPPFAPRWLGIIPQIAKFVEYWEWRRGFAFPLFKKWCPNALKKFLNFGFPVFC